MAKIQLTPEELLAQSEEMRSLQEEFASLFGQTESLLNEMNGNWSGNLANNFAGKITSAQKACTSIITMLTGGADLARTSAQTMESMDSLLAAKTVRRDQWFGSESEEHAGVFGTDSQVGFLFKRETEDREYYIGKAEHGTTTELNTSGKHKFDTRDDLYDETWYEKDGKVLDKTDTQFYDRELTLLEGKWEDKYSVSILDGSVYLDERNKIHATVGEAEVHGELSAGFYVVGADGKRKFSPGVKAEVGGSVTIANIGWEGQILGNDMLGLNAGADVTAGKAEVKASAGLQIYGEDGKLKPQASVEASAEAIAGELSGNIGMNVLGGEVGVSGKVNVGIGAHAEFGYKDGVVKCDVGASLGLGVSVGFEVDVGGMVNTAVEYADKIADVASDVGNAIADGAGAVVDGAKAIWKGIFR